MTATQNSIDTYIELDRSGELGEKQKEILRFIKQHPNCSYNDIARVMHQHHNTVTARIKELRNMGLIVCSGVKKDEFTNKPNNVYRVRKDDEEPDDMSADARPKLPPKVQDFLIRAVKGGEEGNVAIGMQNGVNVTADCVESKVSLNYGEFVKLSNIMVACADSEHDRLILAGVNFTVFFKLN